MVLPACPGCQVRDRAISRLRLRLDNLQKENFKLRQQLDESHREQHRQAAPFRRRTRKKKPRRPGRPEGHPPANRNMPTPDQVDRTINVTCPCCPDCGGELVEPGTVVQYQSDVPPIVPIITQFNIETGWCDRCRKRCQGRHPQQTSNATGAAGHTLGPVVLTMGAELKHRLGVPYRKICDFFETYCGLHIAPATLARAEQRLAKRAGPTFDLLIDALRRANVVHADETGWRVHGDNGWLWVFSNQHVTVYAIRTGKGARGHEVPEEILGPDFDGVLVVDGFKAYTALDYLKGQCNGHLLRRANELKDTVAKREYGHLDELIALIREAIDLAARRGKLKPQGYARRAQEMHNRLEDWLEYLPEGVSPELERLHAHVSNHHGEWFQFLDKPEVPPTNNHAERMLRPAVISRKIGGCNKTLKGALVHSILASIMVTCKQQGQRFLDLARKLWSADEPGAQPLVSPKPSSG